MPPALVKAHADLDRAVDLCYRPQPFTSERQRVAQSTDAPFRETEEAIALAKREGLLAVEMETAALYAFASARRRPVLCLAHVTNCMAKSKGDFEKGEAEGSMAVLGLLGRIAKEWGKKGGKGRAGRWA